MNAGPFYQLHNSGNKYLLPVADGVNFHFLAADVLIYQYRFIFINLYGCF